MPNTEYDRGDRVRMEGAFVDSNSDPADPGEVYLEIRLPDKTTETYQYGVDAALVKDSTGSYHLDYTVSATGSYRYRWYSLVSGITADTGVFYVILP